MDENINPYIVGPPITGEAGFYGRGDIFSFVQDALLSEESRVISLHGQRRIGKTSVLRQLPRHLPKGFRAVYFSLEYRERKPLGEILSDLAETTADGLGISLAGEADVYGDEKSFSTRFLPQVYEALGKERLVLLLDEFDILADEPENAATERFRTYLAELLNRETQPVFIFAIGRRPEYLDAFLSLFRYGLYKRISYLSKDEAGQLIREPVEGKLDYEEDAIERIISLTRGHPYLTQLVCWYIFSQTKKLNKNKVEVTDIESVVDAAIEGGTPSLQSQWDLLTPAAKMYLSAMGSIEEAVVTRKQIEDKLDEHGIDLPPIELTAAPGELHDWELVEYVGEKGYQVTIELMRRWIARDHKLDEEVRKQLKQLSPRAVRAYQRARQAHDAGDFENAIKLYNEALRANPNYPLAQLHLANAIYELGDLSKAVEEFEKAYALDKEADSTRDWLVRVLIEYGETCLEKRLVRDARSAYERALALDPSSSEALDLRDKVQRRVRDVGVAQDFTIVIGKTLEGIEYPVHTSSPAGSVTGVLVLPFSVDQIEQALQNFREGIPLRITRGKVQDELSPEGFGSALFRALFRDKVLALYRESLSITRMPGATNRMPVKLNIIARELARLPWELLYDPERDEFLSFGKDTPVIRFVDREPRPYTFDPPLRVLLVSANPSDSAVLNLQREMKIIEEALDTLKRQDQLRIDHLFGATIPELRRKIREHQPHVIHFMGHGQVNRLLLEDREGFFTPSESNLGIILRNASSLRLVVLNACETARPADSEARLGLAHGLARRGVPAIVAMQFQISDKAACEFAGELYRVLAEGFGVDEAVLWGRIAVQNRFVDDIEWVTPVLYMQTREGRIFDDLLRGPEAEVRIDELSVTRRERVEVLSKQLRIHERNLWRLETQKAKFGIMAPLHLERAIDEEQVTIHQIWEELNQLGMGKEATEPQERPAVGIPEAYQEDAAVDVERRLADPVVTERERLDPRLLEQAQTYYEQGLRHFDKGEWAQAIIFLEDVQRLAPGYRDAQRLVRTAREELRKQETERRTQEKLAALYRQALMHRDEEHWQAAIDLFEEVLRIDPKYEDAEIQAEKARRAHTQQLTEEYTRLRLETLYQQAQRFLAAEDWERATRLLQQVVSIDRDYADALAQLAEARQGESLAELYHRGEEAFVAQDWEQAVANLGAAFALDQSYRDVEEKLERARQQQRWDALYQEGLEYLEAERWDEAIEALREVQPDPKRRKDVKVARLYAEGRQYAAQKKWEPALARFEEIVEENPRYRDAAGQFREARRQKRLYDLYAEGLKRMETQEWRQAIHAFEQVVREASDYRDVQSRLDLTREEAELAERYASGKRFLKVGRWSEAIQDFQSIVKVRPDYPNVQRMLDKATQEKELADLYAEGMRCLDKGLWQEAIDAFEKLVDIAPNYRDAGTQLDDAQEKKLLISAYEQGKACYERKDWSGAIQHFEQVMSYEGEEYRDAAILLAEAKRQERLAQFYEKGIGYLSMQDWDRALSSFEQVVELDQNYEDAATLLEEAQQQKWLADTYAEAMKLVEVEQWEKAVTAFQQILEKDPNYRDAPALLVEAQRQDRLAMSYTAANKAYEKEHWTEAIERFQQILAEDAKYRDVEKKVAEAQWQQGLKENYERGMACFGRDDWEGAISMLGAVVEKEPNYKDAFVKLSEARRHQTLASHYAEGERCMAEERWDDAIAAFEKVMGIDPQYRDVERYLNKANRQKTLAELYADGEKHLESKEWGQAIECFRRVQEMDEGYRDASEKLEKAAHERNLESLHDQGVRFFNAGKWSEALESWDKLMALEPDYRDVAAKIEEARQREIERLRQEADECSRKGELEKEVELLERVEQLKAKS